MKHLVCAIALCLSIAAFSQPSKIKPDKYPSLLWEISGKGAKTSYLFGTMHVSSKMVFNLSDSFYLGLRNAQVVALETNPGTWQEDFSRYDMDGGGMLNRMRYGYDYSGRGYASPDDYLTINTLKLTSYEKMMEAALYSNPAIINNFLYRSGSEYSSDFEEDTYLDLHIFQAGKKLGKKICGVENFDGSMQLVKEAYADAAKEKNKKQKSYDYDEDLSYRRLEEAYRTGNLDLLDTINKVNSQSAAFDEKFLYKRNEIQAVSIDSILKKGTGLFVGVGAAHLPGERGVIEMLRRMGYKLRPIKMVTRDSRHKDAIEKIRVPVQFAKQTAEDGFYSVATPGKLYTFGRSFDGLAMEQFADMINGSYYMVTRMKTNAAILGQSEAQVERKVDSVLYENIPGKILTKKPLLKNGYRGFEITNRTRRGDHQRYNIFVTPFEILIFKMSGNGEYVKLGTEAEQFFNSIQLKEMKPDALGWKKFKPAAGGFEVEMPHQPMVSKGESWQYAAYDGSTKTAFQIIRTDVHNHDFLEEDSFDLNLMEESFASSDFVARQLSRRQLVTGGYPALDVKYKYRDSSITAVRFLINGPRYYTLVSNAPAENKGMQQFLQSFQVKPFAYGDVKKETDTALHFTVQSPVPLEKKKKLDMMPDNALFGGYRNDNDDDSLIDNGKYMDKLVESDSTGEKIMVSYYTSSKYEYRPEEPKNDSAYLHDDLVMRNKKVDTLADGTVVWQYDLRHAKSSRMFKNKSIFKDGVGYSLQTQTDTLSGESTFVRSFFNSFAPADSIKGIDLKKKKTALFFSQFFSTDTLLRKTAIKNIHQVDMDSSDFTLLKRGAESLGWKDKDYLEVKKSFLHRLSDMPLKEASDYLKTVYYASADTVELQYAALETLVRQATAYSYKTFASIVETDPPVLDFSSDNNNSYETDYIAPPRRDYGYDNSDNYGGSFFSNLTDTVQLAAGIYKNLLPLISINDYEQPVMDLTAILLDSSLISAKDYETYLPKFIIEAKQLLKKQIIQEKTKAIVKAQMDEKEKEDSDRYADYNRNQTDYGNSSLNLYATLLLPFWDKHPQVAPIITQMLNSNDKRLKYNTMLQLLRAKRAVPDTMLAYFAAMDEYRYELYTDLKLDKKLALFPAAHKSQVAIARSELLYQQSYNKPDTLVFMKKLPLKYEERDGLVYVFKYKEKKEDNAWKLATVGLLPKQDSLYHFEEKPDSTRKYYDYGFTEFTDIKLTTENPESEQLDKMIKKQLYKKRRSAARFYNDGNRYENYDYNRSRY